MPKESSPMQTAKQINDPQTGQVETTPLPKKLFPEEAVAPEVEALQKALKESKAQVAKLEARDEVWILTSQMPLEPRGDQKAVITYHPELGYFDSELAAENGRKHKEMLKPFRIAKAV